MKRFNYSIRLKHYHNSNFHNSNFLLDFSTANNRGARSARGFQTIPQQVLSCSWPGENQRYCCRVSFWEASFQENYSKTMWSNVLSSPRANCDPRWSDKTIDWSCANHWNIPFIDQNDPRPWWWILYPMK